MLRPVWYYWRQVNGDAAVAGVWCIGNAFLWWGSVPALLASAWFALRGGLLSRRPAGGAPAFTPVALGLVSLLGLGLWLLWGVKGRSLNFMHYMFEAIPFACLALAFLLVRIWDAAPSAHAEAATDAEDDETPAAPAAMAFDAWRGAVAFFCALMLGWFVFYYPLLSALPIPHSFFQAHLWLGRPWI